MKAALLNNVKTYAPSNRSELIDYAVKNHKILVAINAEKILHATPQSREFINENIGYPDGIGAVWALQKKGYYKTIKIPGCELWLDTVAKYYKNKKFYLVGGKQTVIEETVTKLKAEFKGINILSYRNGYITSKKERIALMNDIKSLAPDIVFVAMGSPKQELLMADLQKFHKATYQGLGGSFDVYTGHVHRAPKWWVESNLEWAYRLLKEPKRIKRQIHLLRFFLLLQLNKL